MLTIYCDENKGLASTTWLSPTTTFKKSKRFQGGTDSILIYTA